MQDGWWCESCSQVLCSGCFDRTHSTAGPNGRSAYTHEATHIASYTPLEARPSAASTIVRLPMIRIPTAPTATFVHIPSVLASAHASKKTVHPRTVATRASVSGVAPGSMDPSRGGVCDSSAVTEPQTPSLPRVTPATPIKAALLSAKRTAAPVTPALKLRTAFSSPVVVTSAVQDDTTKAALLSEFTTPDGKRPGVHNADLLSPDCITKLQWLMPSPSEERPLGVVKPPAPLKLAAAPPALKRCVQDEPCDSDVDSDVDVHRHAPPKRQRSIDSDARTESECSVDVLVSSQPHASGVSAAVSEPVGKQKQQTAGVDEGGSKAGSSTWWGSIMSVFRSLSSSR